MEVGDVFVNCKRRWLRASSFLPSILASAANATMGSVSTFSWNSQPRDLVQSGPGLYLVSLEVDNRIMLLELSSLSC